MGKNIAKWNAEKRFPPLTYVSSRELFRAVEKATLPTYAGEMPSYWDVLQSLGNECLMADRRLDGRLLAAEKFAALASLVSPDFAYPREKLEQVWEDRLYVVEHNWGGTNGEISDRVKTEKTRQACAINDAVLDSAFRSLAGAVRLGRQDATPIVVFNPLSWDRKDIVTCTLPRERLGELDVQVHLVDSAGKPVPYQVVPPDPDMKADHIQIAFCADVPSLGYATYYAVAKAAPAAASPFRADVEQNRFENDFYRLTLDPDTGGIKSLFDKRGRKELVRQDSHYACNELVAREDDEVDNKCHFTGKKWQMREQPSTIKVVENGPVRLVVEVMGRVVDDSTRRQEIILYRDLPRVDLVTTLGWQGKKNIQLYQAFPLNVAKPTVRYAVPYGWEELGREMKYAAPWPFGPVAGYPWRGMRGWAEAADGDFEHYAGLRVQHGRLPRPGRRAGGRLLDPAAAAADGAELRRRQSLLHAAGRAPLPLRAGRRRRLGPAGRGIQYALDELRGLPRRHRRRVAARAALVGPRRLRPRSALGGQGRRRRPGGDSPPGGNGQDRPAGSVRGGVLPADCQGHEDQHHRGGRRGVGRPRRQARAAHRSGEHRDIAGGVRAVKWRPQVPWDL